jgi:hypothetical protein
MNSTIKLKFHSIIVDDLIDSLIFDPIWEIVYNQWLTYIHVEIVHQENHSIISVLLNLFLKDDFLELNK